MFLYFSYILPSLKTVFGAFFNNISLVTPSQNIDTLCEQLYAYFTNYLGVPREDLLAKVFSKDDELLRVAKKQFKNLEIDSMPDRYYRHAIGIDGYVGRNEWEKFCVDYIENLGFFVELESETILLINNFKEKMSLRWEEIRHGYTNLYVKEVLGKNIPSFKDKFISNQKWNVLEGHEEIIKNIIAQNNN